MSKKVLSGLMTTVLLSMIMLVTLSLTGCGGQTAESTSSQQESGENSSDSTGSDVTTVRLGVMTGYYDSWLATIGQETGIYGEHGLDVQSTEFAAGINTVDALTTDQIDIGFTADFAGVNRLGNTADQTTLRYFSSFAYSAATGLYANPDTVKSLSDLKGKSMITLLGTVWEYYNAVAVEAAGLSTDDVSYKAVDSTQDGLAVAKSGEADAFFASGENAQRLQKYGWEEISTAEELGIVSYNLYMATQEYLEQNQDTVVAFLEANQDIMDYITENEDEAAKILNDKQGLEESVFKNQLKGITYDLSLDQSAYDDLVTIADWAYSHEYFDNAIEIKDFINTDALQQAYPDKVSFTE